MKKKLLFTITLSLICGGFLFAQPKAAGKPKVIVQLSEALKSPVWSNDGKKLAMTSYGNSGIWIVDASGLNLKQITADQGAGYKMKWSADNSTILARTSVLENRCVFNEVKAYNVETKSEELILPKTRQLKGMPYWSNDKSKVLYKVGTETRSSKPVAKAVPLKSQADVPGEMLLRRMVEDPALVAGEVSGLSEFKGRIIFNPVLSPAGDKIVFQVGGEGLLICDADGSNMKRLGEGENASWTPDGKYVIASVVKDDGRVVTKGELFAIDVNTGARSAILASDAYVALRPAISPDGKKLAFEEYASGAIYVIDLK
ncbi:PD40 domain-containing protein [Dysgonomonas sp. 520]|uniref:TolB family protein n=1 Tax=Dysgonomonas sp. 520 TaxID=2302931 RepID=UPI0013D7DDC9|nr:PD40 domain-containing protein [Dysgonomonas sp. 520]NDW11203.1 hypothetical protein [Dysgonomonas sp. 520]